jgi:phosphate-selective porin
MRKVLMATIISAFCASGALAQATPPATTPPAATQPAAAKMPKAKATDKPRSAESLECSKQADAKGLHGKERKTFRANCKKEMMKKKT